MLKAEEGTCDPPLVYLSNDVRLPLGKTPGTWHKRRLIVPEYGEEEINSQPGADLVALKES